MQRYILRRVLRAALSVIGATLIVFLATRLVGDPVSNLIPPENYMTAGERERVRADLGLDKPVLFQYVLYLGDLLRGDLGMSWRYGEPVFKRILERLPNTLKLALLAFAISHVIGIGVGVLAAARPDSIYDRVGKVVALVGQSAPAFWVGIMLILVFAVRLQWFPASGTQEGFKSMVLPALTLGAFSMAAIMRLTRSSMLTVLDSEFVKLHRIKGVPEHLIVLKHALKNACIPVVTLLGLQIAALVTGTVVIETIFGWPGVGLLAYNSIITKDLPVVQGVVLLGSVSFVAANLIVDVSYAYLDPRVRYS